VAITFFGSTSSPADNGTSTATQITLTPPASMTTGCLVYVRCYQRGTATFSVGVTGGQTWNSLTRQVDGTTNATQAFWCTFNGTWSANPRFDFSAGTNTNAVMLVFQPTDTGKVFAVDTAESTVAFAAPTTPFTVTIPGRTPVNASTVSIAAWVTADDNTWGTLAGTGWSKTSLAAQYRNTSGNDMSSTYAYRILTTATATNNVSQNQATLGGDGGVYSIVTFDEEDPGAFTQAVAGTLTMAGAVATANRTPRAVTGTLTTAGTLTSAARFVQGLTGTLTMTGVVTTVARFAKAMTGSLSSSGSVDSTYVPPSPGGDDALTTRFRRNQTD